MRQGAADDHAVGAVAAGDAGPTGAGRDGDFAVGVAGAEREGHHACGHVHVRERKGGAKVGGHHDGGRRNNGAGAHHARSVVGA